MKHRLERVRELIKRELSEIVAREISFSPTLVTITSVDVTPDLKHAHIFVSTIGGTMTREAVLAKLAEHRRPLQHLLSRRVILKYTPQLAFHSDESIERGVRIIQIMEEIEHQQPEGEEQ